MAFDTEKLIREIKKRKAIWDVFYPQYRDRDLKRRLWEEITFAICGVDNMTGSEMREFCTALQLKWKNIRTCFNRELKRRAGIKTGAAADRKTPYVYFEQLQFLKEIMVNNPSQASMDEQDAAEGSDGGVGDKIPAPAKTKKQKTEDESFTGVSNQSISKDEERERNREGLEESDPDTVFLRSLLKDFNKIPINRRHSTKIELLAVLIRAQMPPLEYEHHDYMEGTSATLSDSCRNEMTYIEGDHRSGRPSTSRTDENVEKNNAHIQEEARRIMDQLSELSGLSWNSPEKILSGNSGIGEVRTKQEPENELDDSSTNEQAQLVTTECLELEPDEFSEESREPSCGDEKRCQESSAEAAPDDQGESPTRKKRKTENNGNDDKLTEEAFNLLKQVANRPKPAKDESYLFCELLCLKLRALDADTREIAMHEINNLMFNLRNKKQNVIDCC